MRRLAEEHNIDLNNVVGTGPGGRVTREDVLDRGRKAGGAGDADSSGRGCRARGDGATAAASFA